MVLHSIPLDPWENSVFDIEPRCAKCELAVPGEWINWQRCWSTPYQGEAGQPRILARTSVSPNFDNSIVLRLHCPAHYASVTFWLFFVCVGRRRRLRARGMYFDRKEIIDRKVIIIVRGAGPHDVTPQHWPCLICSNITTIAESDEWFGAGSYYSPPSSPSSEGTNPWQDHFDY